MKPILIPITMSNSTTAPGIEYLGLCFNILTMDPFNLKSNQAVSVVTQDTSKYKEAPGISPIAGTNWNVPPGTYVQGLNSATDELQTFSISNSYEYQKTSSTHVSVGIGIPDVFSFSASTSFQSLYQSSGSEKHSAAYAVQNVKVYRAHLTAFPLSTEFNQVTKNEVLPQGGHQEGVTFSDSSPFVNEDFITAVKNLPTTLDGGKSDYANFLKTWGTHFASAVDVGGYARLWSQFSSSAYSSLAKSGTSISAGLSATYDDVSGSASGGNTSSTSNSFKSATSTSSADFRWVGGEVPGDGKFATWANSVKNAPVAVRVDLTPITSLLDSAYIADDQINSKKEALTKLINLYYFECGLPKLDLSSMVPAYDYRFDFGKDSLAWWTVYQTENSLSTLPPQKIDPNNIDNRGYGSFESFDLQGFAFWTFNASSVPYTFYEKDGSDNIQTKNSSYALKPVYLNVKAGDGDSGFYYDKGSNEEGFNTLNGGNPVFYTFPENTKNPPTTNQYQYINDNTASSYCTPTESNGSFAFTSFNNIAGTPNISPTAAAPDDFFTKFKKGEV